MHEAELAAKASGGQLHPGQGFDDDSVGLADRADVADESPALGA